ncbi:MAG: phosphoribosylanthranilate isomerase [Gammaproteobacteria bacterium]|nr:phosphoribosylanthranilate isomerase [Gammaproteobacteria bacterium]
MFVKICGLRDATCVAAAVEAGANAVGFVFAESVRRISAAKARELAEDVPAQVRRVAVMHHPSNEEWQSVLEQFAPDTLQTDAGDFDSLDIPDGVVRWPVIRQSIAQSTPGFPDVFVYEGPKSGAGKTVNWEQARVVSEQGRMILAGGLDAANVGVAIRTVRPWGVDASSGLESTCGNKDVELIRQFVLAVRAAENDE